MSQRTVGMVETVLILLWDTRESGKICSFFFSPTWRGWESSWAVWKCAFACHSEGALSGCGDAHGREVEPYQMLSEGRPHLIHIQGGTDMTHTNPETISSKEMLAGFEMNRAAWILPLSPVLTWSDVSVLGFYLGEFISCEKLKSGLSARTRGSNPLNISS